MSILSLGPSLGLLLLAGLLSIPPAHADLTIVPTRVVLEERDRNAVLTIVNRGDHAETFRLSWQHLRQLRDGRYQEIATPAADDLFADVMIRLSPRQITLEPGEQQIVRLLLRKPPDLPPGEYRSHLLFSAEPQVLGTPQASSGAIGIELKVAYGLSIPVIVRHGPLSASASLSFTWRRVDKMLAVTALIERQGNKSVYGDILVQYQPPQGEPVTLRELQGLSVLPPSTEHEVPIDIAVPPELSLAHGRIKVTYREPAEKGGAVLAEASQPLE